MKALKSPHVSPFGGLNFVFEQLDELQIGAFLNSELPLLPSQSRYDWRDLFYSLWSVIFCGGNCAEDLGYNLKPSLSNIPNLRAPSPDRVLERMKQLASPTVLHDTKRGKVKHEFNYNDKLNILNLKLLKKLSCFDQNTITLDYDNTLIFTNKADANMTYKKQFGYAPGVGIVGSKVVYVENRNGNSDPQTLQNDTLGRMFALLNQEGISIDKFRADSASYQLSTIDCISKNADKLYVRTRMSETITQAIKQIETWEEIVIGNEAILRGETTFIPFQNAAKRNKQNHLLKTYRLVVSKVKRVDGQINVFTQEAYNYHGIITNDYEMSANEVVIFYNQRGAIEREFDVLKNDFCWSHMPFSKMNQNTVFLLYTAICRNLYDHLIIFFSKKVKGLKPSDRLKKFIFRLICIPAKWVQNARVWKLRIYGQSGFSP